MTLKRRSGSLELFFSLFAVLALILIVTVWILLPNIREYQKQSDTYKAQREQLDNDQQTYDRLFETHRRISQTASGYEEMFANSYEAGEMKAWGDMTFDAFTISEAANTISEKGLSYKEFNVSANINSPTEFYSFVRKLHVAPWVLRIHKPVVMEKTSRGIALGFRMSMHSNE